MNSLNYEDSVNLVTSDKLIELGRHGKLGKLGKLGNIRKLESLDRHGNTR